jgi:hypothetical protein
MQPAMPPEINASRRSGWLCLTGLAAIVLALAMPGCSSCRVFGFLATFHAGNWGSYFEWTPMRGNLRFMVVCLGLCLVIDGAGLWLLRTRHTLLGNLVFVLYAVPLAGLAVGAYYFLKAVF